jgi:hypothetical protein
VQEVATGRLKWLPDDFLRQDLDDTLIAIKGHFDERTEDERIFRRLGLMSIGPYVDKSFDIYKYWPIHGDEDAGKQQRSTLLQKLRQHRLEEQQKKQNASN